MTHPDYAGRRLGALISWWALGYASRTGYDYVRRGCAAPALLRYYRDVQGWSLTHETERRGVTMYLLSRIAAPQPGLTNQITD